MNSSKYPGLNGEKEKKKNCANLIFHSQNVSMTIFCERKAKCVYCYFSGAFLP